MALRCCMLLFFHGFLYAGGVRSEERRKGERRGVLACVVLQGATCRSLPYESPESLWQKETIGSFGLMAAL